MNHRILWISVLRMEGDLWKTCIFLKNSTPEKALKTRLFSVMIGALPGIVIHNDGQLSHILWKCMWISTGFPQFGCAYADNH